MTFKHYFLDFVASDIFSATVRDKSPIVTAEDQRIRFIENSKYPEMENERLTYTVTGEESGESSAPRPGKWNVLFIIVFIIIKIM